MVTQFNITVLMVVITLCSLGCMTNDEMVLEPAEMSADQWAKLEDGMTEEAVLEIAPKFSKRFDGEGTTTLVYDTPDKRYQVIFSQGELEMKDLREKSE